MKDIYSMSLEELRAAKKQLENSIQEVKRLIYVESKSEKANRASERFLERCDKFEKQSRKNMMKDKRKAK